MNNAEFQIWLNHANVVIPSLVDWAAKIKKHPDKNFDKIIGFWRDRLSRVELSAARDAIERLPPRSQYEKADQYYEQIPRKIVDMLAEPATMSPGRQFVDGQQTVKCTTCNDEGFRTIWHQKSITAMRDNPEAEPTTTCAVRCTCDAGHRKSKNITMFDPSQHCVAVDVYDDGRKALREFLNPHDRAKNLAGYDKQLAGFNEPQNEVPF